MATEFHYSILNDFPNQVVDAAVLTVEILNSSIAPALDGITINVDDVRIDFTTDLSVGEVTTLDGLVAAHQGIPFNEATQRVNVIAAQDNATTNWQQAAQLTAEPISGTKYQLQFYCELRTLNGVNNSRSHFQVLLDGADVASGGVRGVGFFDARSGSLVVNTTRGTSPVVTMEFRRQGASDTAQIRRVRLALIPLLEEE